MSASSDELDRIELDYRDTPSNKRKRITFVPEQSHDSPSEFKVNPDSKSVGDSYLDLVLSPGSKGSAATQSTGTLCQVCKLPLESSPSVAAHESSIAHQVCLKHSYPPSSIDRSRKGLAYLQSYGWDPDSRRGLGATREGILFPIKALEKKDHAGIGTQVEETRTAKSQPKKIQRLNAKQVKKLAAEDKVKREKLQRMFYTDDEVEKYLGPNA